MLAIWIFRHALLQLVHEPAAIFRMIWAPLGLHLLANYTLFDSADRQLFPLHSTDPVPPEIAGRMLLMSVLHLLLAVWVAVPFHRYFLCNRKPDTLSVPDRATGGYLLRSILIGVLGTLLLFAVIIAPLIALMTIVRDIPQVWLQRIVMIPVFLVMPFIMRWAVCLPGIAIGADAALERGNQATSRQYRTFLLLALFSAGFSFLFDELIALTGLPVLYHTSSQWLAILLNLSILTTIWGHFVEGRELH